MRKYSCLGLLIVANALLELKREVETNRTAYNIEPDAARCSILMMGGQCSGGNNFNVVPGECTFTIDRRINPEENLEEEKRRIIETLESLSKDGIDRKSKCFKRQNRPALRKITRWLKL